MQEVRRLREEKRWGQKELAFYAGLSQSVISEIETGKRKPNTRTLEKLATALEVEVGDLFPKGQRPLPFEAYEASVAAAGEPAVWLGERLGHAHLALRSTGELLEMVSREGADENMAMLRKEYEATQEMERSMLLGLDPASKFLAATLAYIAYKKEQGLSEEAAEVLSASGAHVDG